MKNSHNVQTVNKKKNCHNIFHDEIQVQIIYQVLSQPLDVKLVLTVNSDFWWKIM